MSALPDQPLFDNPRNALVFALNQHDVKMPRPAMTTAMAQGIKTKAKRGKAKRKRDEDDLAANLEKEAEYARLVRAAFRKPTARLGDSIDRAAQAGFILAEFAKLEASQRVVLTGMLMQSHRPCACRRPCCSGRAVNLAWAKAVEDTCLLLRDSGDVIRKPGTRGLSTQPGLRRAIVTDYFTQGERTIVDLARLAECSQITAAKHKAWIVEYLEQEATAGLERISELLDSVGIVGAIV